MAILCVLAFAVVTIYLFGHNGVIAFACQASTAFLLFFMLLLSVSKIVDSSLLKMIIALILLVLAFLSPVGLGFLAAQTVMGFIVLCFPFLNRIYFMIPGVIVLGLLLRIPLESLYWEDFFKHSDFLNQLTPQRRIPMAVASMVPAVFVFVVDLAGCFR